MTSPVSILILGVIFILILLVIFLSWYLKNKANEGGEKG